jgi:hypothetical protein
VSEPWSDRAAEERYSLNPALLGVLLYDVATGYQARAGRAFPFYLSFLALPAVLHRPTREALPRDIRTSLPLWLGSHPLEREAVAQRVVAFADLVGEGLLLALRTGHLRLVDTGVEPGLPVGPTVARRAPSVANLRRAATLVGDWFGAVGSETTIFALWGARI